MFVSVMWALLKTQSAVSAGTRPGLIEVDVYSGMSEGSTTIADGYATVDDPDGLFAYEVHCARGVGLQLHVRLLEART